MGVGKTFASGCTELPTVSCKEHEEADTRMSTDAAYCVQTYACNAVVLQAAGTKIKKRVLDLTLSHLEDL